MVLTQRVSMAQAGRVKDALAAELGDADGDRRDGGARVPGAGALASVDEFPGVWASKLERIRGLAGAALAGELDPAFLRGLDSTRR